MNLVVINIIGFLATSTSLIRFMPQAIRTWKIRNNSEALYGLSLSSQWLTFVNSLLWITYGILLGQFWVAAPSVLNAPMAAMIIILIMRSRKNNNAKMQLLEDNKYLLGVAFAEGKITEEEYNTGLNLIKK